jgi:hypothetical protein
MQNIMTYLVGLIEGGEAEGNNNIHRQVTSALYTIANMMALGSRTNNLYDDIMEHISESLALAEFLVSQIRSRLNADHVRYNSAGEKLPGTNIMQLYAGVDVTKN